MNTNSQRLGKYELRELLGHGGMAEVWKAFDTHLQRYVAIKILHPELQNDPGFIKRFEREARVMAGLHHPNIVQIHDFHISKPPESARVIAYMVMEYIEGQTLASYIYNTSAQGAFPPASDILYLFACTCSAIDYAHRRGMLHRDIKPGNILLDQRTPSRSQLGEPILTDFGIVKLLGSSTGTLSGGWLGTPVYISPEQAQGHPCDGRSDIYSFGVILYEICTGVRPFQGENPIAIVMQHISVMPTSPERINPQIPPALAQVVMCALAKDPEERFATASEMAAALAGGFHLPLPVNLSQPISLSGIAGEPTYKSRFEPVTPPIMTPSTPVLPGNEAAKFSYLAIPSTPPAAVPVDGELITPIPPIENMAKLPFNGDAVQHAPGTMLLDAATPLPAKFPPIRRQRRRWNGRLVALVVLVLLVLASSGLGAFYWLSALRAVPATTSSSSSTTADILVGHASFVSSGQLVGGNSSQGINDELELHLSNIPAANTSYFAWLLSDIGVKPEMSLLLGKLSVNGGDVDFLYPGDQRHTNLIGTMSRLLITEEDNTKIPAHPSGDQRMWRYYAELPQTLTGGSQHGKAIDTLRSLLYKDNRLEAVGLHGGLDIHLYLNAQKVFEWAASAKDAWQKKDATTIHQQVVRILDYLDGASLARTDLSANAPLLVDPTLATVPLINFQNIQVLKSYAERMHNSLGTLLSESGVTPNMRQLATQADAALTGQVKDWLEQARYDAVQLVKMTNAQLQLSSTLPILNDLAAQATYAYNGRTDPSTGKLLEGIVQIHHDVQQLISFDIRPYSH